MWNLFIWWLYSSPSPWPWGLAFSEGRRHSRHISTLKQQFVVIHTEASATFKVSVFTLLWATPSICHHFGLCNVKQSNKSKKQKLPSGFILSFFQILYNSHHLAARKLNSLATNSWLCCILIPWLASKRIKDTRHPWFSSWISLFYTLGRFLWDQVINQCQVLWREGTSISSMWLNGQNGRCRAAVPLVAAPCWPNIETASEIL